MNYNSNVVSLQYSGGYILGFRADPPEALDMIYDQITRLWKVFSAKPVFGVEFVVQDVVGMGGWTDLTYFSGTLPI